MTGYIATLAVAAVPMALLVATAPRINRWTDRRRAWRTAREEADAQTAAAWFRRIERDGDDFPQTLAPPSGTESLADYIDRVHPETRSAA